MFTAGCASPTVHSQSEMGLNSGWIQSPDATTRQVWSYSKSMGDCGHVYGCWHGWLTDLYCSSVCSILGMRSERFRSNVTANDSVSTWCAKYSFHGDCCFRTGVLNISNFENRSLQEFPSRSRITAYLLKSSSSMNAFNGATSSRYFKIWSSLSSNYQTATIDSPKKFKFQMWMLTWTYWVKPTSRISGRLWRRDTSWTRWNWSNVSIDSDLPPVDDPLHIALVIRFLLKGSVWSRQDMYCCICLGPKADLKTS